MKKILLFSIFIIFAFNSSISADELKCKTFDLKCKSKKFIKETKDYQIKGSVTPLQLAEENIRRLMVNEKKIAFLQNIENKLLQDGVASGKVKIY